MLILPEFIVFLIIIAFIAFIDKKMWGTLYTPVNVLAFPFFIILSLSYVYLKKNFDHFELNPFVIPIWIGGIVFFWFGSLFWKLIIPSAKMNNAQIKEQYEFSLKKSELLLLIKIALIIISIAGYKIYVLLENFGFNIANEEFQKKLGVGFIGHTILFLTILCILFLVFFQDFSYKFSLFVIIIITLSFSLLYGVKSWIIIPLISGFIGRLIIRKTKFKAKHVILFMIPLLIFWLIYQISLGFNSSNNQFIFNHMRDYILAGPIGFSEHLNQNFPIGTLPDYAFIPLENIANFLLGQKNISPISDYFVTIPTNFETNVKTFFGTLFIYGGYSYIFVSLIIGIIFYAHLLVLFIFRKKEPLVLVNYCFMLGLLFMGWFEIYTVHLAFYEVPFLAFIINQILKYRLNENTYFIKRQLNSY